MTDTDTMGGEGSPELVSTSELRAAQATIGRLNEQVAALTGQMDEAITAAEAARAAADQARADSLAHLRRALLAEHRGQVVEELVQGETDEALQASVEAARTAMSRAVEAARRQLQDQQVPAGTPTRDSTAPGLEGLSPTDKIAHGLRK